MKPSTIATMAKTMCRTLDTVPPITKSEANAIFERIAETCRTRKAAAQSLCVSFFDLNPEDEIDALRIERATASTY